MTEFASTANADSTGSATVTVVHGKSGLQWILWQLTIETIPTRTAASAVVRRNGAYITSSIIGSGSSAQGPPAIVLNDSDVLSVTWSNMTQGDECIARLLYEEVPYGQMGSTYGRV